MRVLVFNWRDITHPWAGGAELVVHEQAKRWVQAGHHVTLFCGEYPGAHRHSSIDGIEVIRRGGRYTVYLWAVIHYLAVLRGKYDIVIDVENGIPFFTPLFCRRPKCCIVYHIHSGQFMVEFGFPLNRIGRFLETVVMPAVYRRQHFITISESTRDEMLRIGICQEYVDVLPCGLDHATYCPMQGKSMHPSIIYLGRLKAYKRVDLLIRMMPRILSTVPQAQLHIVGKGESQAELNRLVEELSLAGAVTFHGWVSTGEKVRLLQQAWVFVTPSMNEGWGLSVLEANACGTPAVAFGVTGLRSSIKNAHTGLLANDSESMIDSIVAILTDETLRHRLEQGALQWAAEFSWERTSAESLEYLKNLAHSDERAPD